MKYSMTQEEKFEHMTNTPVKNLICSLAVPTIISMLITSIYNMADTFFVGQINTSATAAVGVAFSLMTIIQAIGFTFGNGSGNYVSRLLGQKNNAHASKVASTGFFSALILGFSLALIGLLFLDPFVRLLGATPTILPYAKSYIRLILIGMPYMAASFVLNNLLRFQGSAFYAMIGITTGGILNIALDPLFIFVFHMGITGAALATIISQFISFLILLRNSGAGGTLRMNFRYFTPRWAIYKEILRGGLPSFYRQGLASISTIVLNFCAGPFGDAAIAAMSIVNRIFMFASSALIGFGQGFQPVCGFNYGAKKYQRVMDGFYFCVKTAVGVLIFISIIGFLFAPQIVTVFRKDDLDVIRIGTLALRIQCVTFPLSSWIILSNMMLQTIGKSFKASVLAMSRQGLFYVPAILLLSSQLGLLGIQMTQSIAEVCTFLLAIPMSLSVLKELKAGERENREAENALSLSHEEKGGV